MLSNARVLWYKCLCMCIIRGKGFGSTELNLEMRKIMKKIVALLLCALITVGVFTACGASDEAKKVPVEQYVTLGEYKGVEVVVEKIAASEDEIEAYAFQIYSSLITADNGGIKDRAIELGDTANIDYVGKKDGVAFDGGTAQGYNLGIGSGSFIDGFEEGLVGVKPGETVDLNLTFPEGYQAEDLAGQEVVFTVTVNYIVPAVPADMNDAVVAGFANEAYSNVAELNAYAATELEASNQAAWETEGEYAVLNAIINNATFTELPEEYLEEARTSIESTLNMYASYYGLDAATFCLYAYGMKMEAFVEAQSENYAKELLVYQAIANAENLNVSDKELKEKLEQYAKEAGVSTEEYLGEATEEDFRQSLMVENVYNFIQDNAVVKSE